MSAGEEEYSGSEGEEEPVAPKAMEPRKCRAVADYVAKADDELTFREGDVIFVPNPTRGDRWQGVFQGKVGFFPRVLVDDKTVEIKKAGETTRVRAMRDYTKKEGTEELTFPKGAVMFVVARENEEYFRGVYKGVSGLIPALAVEDAGAEEEAKAKEAVANGRYQAIKSHVTSDTNGLNFKLGDIVFVPKPDAAIDMWKGVCNGEIGEFPHKGYVVDTAAHSKEEIEKMLEDAKASPEEQEKVEAVVKQRRKTAAALEQVAEKMAAVEVTDAPAPSPAASAAAQALGDELAAPAAPAAQEAPASAAATAATASAAPDATPAAAAAAAAAAPAAAAPAAAAEDEQLTPKQRKALEKKEAKEAKLAAKKAAAEAKAAAKEAKLKAKQEAKEKKKKGK